MDRRTMEALADRLGVIRYTIIGVNNDPQLFDRDALLIILERIDDELSHCQALVNGELTRRKVQT